MSVLAPAALPPVHALDTIDAFRSAMRSLNAGPDTVTETVMNGLEHFRATETGVREVTADAIKGGDTAVEAGTTAAGDGTAAGNIAAMQSGQKRSVGLMMQTYDFALEATLVSNAATTFTNSVNTLIKTQ